MRDVIWKTLKKCLLNLKASSLEGRLDTNTSPEFEKTVLSLDGVKHLILDMEKLEYISSAGLRIILSLQKTMCRQGDLKLINVKEVLDMTGFSEILSIE